MAVRSLVHRGLVAHPEPIDEAERVALTPDGLVAVERWLDLVASLFARWPPDVPGVDDATG
jgi:hypothetical protein